MKTPNVCKRVNEELIACIIFHNILHVLHDEWMPNEDECEENDNDEDHEMINAAARTATNDAAKQIRIIIQNSCLNWFYGNR